MTLICFHPARPFPQRFNGEGKCLWSLDVANFSRGSTKEHLRGSLCRATLLDALPIDTAAIVSQSSESRGGEHVCTRLEHADTRDTLDFVFLHVITVSASQTRLDIDSGGLRAFFPEFL